MSEILTFRETQEKREAIGRAMRFLEELLNSKGPYRWDLPSKLLLPGDKDYNFFVCRSNVYLERLYALEYLVKIGALPLSQENLISDVIANVRAISRRPGLRTQEDMEELKRELTQAYVILAKTYKQAAA